MIPPQYLGPEQVTALTPWPALIDAIREAFASGGVSPGRHHHRIPGGDREDITLLLMPAWNRDGDFGVKLAALSPTNAGRGLETLNGVYVLFCGVTGIPRVILDAGALTARRTAAASALASRYLSRPQSRVLLVIGTGRVASELIGAHCSQRPIEEVRIWGRNSERARLLAQQASERLGLRCRSVLDIETGAAGADIISTATPSTQPLLLGDWVDPGTHVDLVGAFTPEMAECDSELIARADAVFVDTLEGARDEAGELIQAAAKGAFRFSEIAGDLYQLCAENAAARNHAEQITVYKSVGVALQDLAAALLCNSAADLEIRGDGLDLT